MIRIGILGASGYTGLELLKILAHHPAVEVAWLTSENSAGQRFGDLFALALPQSGMELIPLAGADLAGVDVVFACLPHGTTQAPVAAALSAGTRVVDLSADFRLHDPVEYQRWYGHAHTQVAWLAQAVYGLPELHRAAICQASLVANPGCYPTSIIVGLMPLARAGWLQGTVVADSKSGVSGAGRQPSLKTHFVETSENVSPYNVGRTHRHLPEMEQELRPVAAAAGGATVANGAGWRLVFSPHLVPVNRGIVSTIYAALPDGVGEAMVRAAYQEAYAAEPFVRILPPGQLATMAHSVDTNYCTIGLTLVPDTQTLIVTSSIDNLIKGASGQAVQNMNLMFGMPETAGLQ